MALLVSLWVGSGGLGGIGSAWGEPENIRTVRVHGEVEESAPIDRAIVPFLLISEGKTPTDAEERDRTRFSEVKGRIEEELRGEGKIWRTTEMRLLPVLAEEKGKKEGKERIVAYRIERREAVEVREFSRLGKLLAALFATGVDEVAEVEWQSDRVDSLYRELLGKATVMARAKAEALAKAAGAQLGPVVNIQEGGLPPRPFTRFEGVAVGAMAKGVNAPAPVTISGGELRIRASVQAVYRLW